MGHGTRTLAFERASGAQAAIHQSWWIGETATTRLLEAWERVTALCSVQSGSSSEVIALLTEIENDPARSSLPDENGDRGNPCPWAARLRAHLDATKTWGLFE